MERDGTCTCSIGKEPAFGMQLHILPLNNWIFSGMLKGSDLLLLNKKLTKLHVLREFCDSCNSGSLRSIGHQFMVFVHYFSSGNWANGTEWEKALGEQDFQLSSGFIYTIEPNYSLWIQCHFPQYMYVVIYGVINELPYLKLFWSSNTCTCICL